MLLRFGVDRFVFVECKSDVVVGLWLSDYRNGKSDYPSGQQHLEQHTYLTCWTGVCSRFSWSFCCLLLIVDW